MIGFGLACRFYHTSTTRCAASLLGKLRRSTGFPISNCKKALEQFPDDFQKAEEWLQSESKKMGWSKWNKIQTRSAAQGRVGLYVKENLGIMVEVNCETDFVAKNMEFRNLVGNVLFTCVENSEQYNIPEDMELYKSFLTEDDLMKLESETFTMQELLHDAINKFNEKTVFKRAVILKGNSNISMAGLTHPTEVYPSFHQFQTGRFGAIMAYHSKEEKECAFCYNMCQHIIGMSPSSLGDLKDVPKEGEEEQPPEIKGEEVKEKEEEQPHEIKGEEVKEEEEEEEKAELIQEEEESRLLFQPYMLDPNVRVHNYVDKQATIVDFVRFECGG